jgi:Alpha/beta hydrolase family
MLGAAVVAILAAACSDSESPSNPSDNGGRSEPAGLDRIVDIGGGRGLYVRCTGEGSPTVVMEGGDQDTSSSYAFAEESIAAETRACVYDRANLGQSDPDPGPRGLQDLVGDLAALLEAAEIPSPYVLVGTSGGGYITAGYAVTHKDEVAGMVFIDTFSPFKNPPQPILEETAWDHPGNVEQRDYLQVEKDGWRARERVGDIPVTVVSVEYSDGEISASPFPSERRALRTNVQEQRGWLVLSPRAEQIVVKTGHAVEEADPEFVIDVILDVVRAAR